jgi:hypothetical protein
MKSRIESFKTEREFDLKTLLSCAYGKIQPMGVGLRSYSECSPNEQGVITVGRGDSETAPFENSYTVVYRNGLIEAARAGLIARNESTNLVAFFAYEQSVGQYIAESLKFLSALGCNPPVLVGITIFGVQGAKLLHPGDQYGIPRSAPFQSDVISLPPIRFDNLSMNIGQILKPSIDRAWQQVGHLSSPYLNEAGVWVGTGPWR